MSKYGEPWILVESDRGFVHLIYDAEGRLVCVIEGSGGKDSARELATAKRVKDSVNALAGLEPGDVAKMVGLAREFAALDDGDERFVWKHPELFERLHALVDRLPK
jgi:hypothetical protein